MMPQLRAESNHPGLKNDLSSAYKMAMIKNDEKWMHVALKQAQKAFEMDEVPIGAVLVNADETWHAAACNQVITRQDATAHAEIMALRKAGQMAANYRLLNSTLYVTIEPCVMCMGALIHARIKRVVFGAKDPKWGAAGSLYDFGQDSRFNHQIEVTSGIMEASCRTLMQTFFKERRSR